MTNKTNEFGFTLIEMILVVTIILILATFAIPNFMDWRRNMYVKSTARDLFSAMQEARLIAIKNNSTAAIVFDTVNNKFYLCDDSGPDGDWDGAGDFTGTGDNTIVTTYDLSMHINGVQFGPSTIVGITSVDGGVIPADGISYTNDVMTANSRGTGKSGYAYIQNADGDKIYAVGTQSNGNIRFLRWYGGSWQ